MDLSSSVTIRDYARGDLHRKTRSASRPPARHRIVLAYCGLPSTAHIDQLLDERISTNGRACAVRMEAAALPRDINKAQTLFDRLPRRYLNANKHNEQLRAM